MTKPKTIQVITRPTGGGAEILVRELGNRVSDHGFDSEVIYFNTDSSGAQHFSPNENETVLGVSNRSLKAIWMLRAEFQKRVDKSEKVIVHAHLTWAFFYVALASIGLDIKLIYTEHSTTNKRRKIPFFQYIERFFYGRYAKIICISEGTKDSLDAWIGQNLSANTQVVQNGSRIYEYKNRESHDGILKFVSVGSLTYKKGFETAIKALAMLEDKQWTYKIIGEGPEREKLQNLINELGLGKNIELVGWSEEIEKHLHDADIQLIPSLWEGFGLVAVEGMSTGLPIVAYNVDGLREVLDKQNLAVFLVDDYKNPDAFSVKIKECINAWNKEATKMAKASRDQSEKFSMDSMVCGYVEVYKKVLEIE